VLLLKIQIPDELRIETAPWAGDISTGIRTSNVELHETTVHRVLEEAEARTDAIPASL
jgi:hypothetical protein